MTNEGGNTKLDYNNNNDKFGIFGSIIPANGLYNLYYIFKYDSSNKYEKCNEMVF